MTFLAQPLGFTPDEFQTYVAGLRWKLWKPQFLTLHNTAEPNLAQWNHSGLGKVAGERRVQNLNHYYKVEQGWHSGPHLFIAPDLIWIACDLTANGVHASCYNSVSIGVEMVGDFSRESFDSGDGAKVRDNAIAALAILHKALKIDPRTLRFHKECLKDHHDCPGKNVVKADVIVRVQAWPGSPVDKALASSLGVAKPVGETLATGVTPVALPPHPFIPDIPVAAARGPAPKPLPSVVQAGPHPQPPPEPAAAKPAPKPPAAKAAVKKPTAAKGAKA
jgi:hypothetical protein